MLRNANKRRNRLLAICAVLTILGCLFAMMVNAEEEQTMAVSTAEAGITPVVAAADDTAKA
ncbi:MAG: hypothetical protein J6Z00_00050, partial [Clostridia bacterium]|nr:hypothetical protein [Clostridia bacterium]